MSYRPITLFSRIAFSTRKRTHLWKEMERIAGIKEEKKRYGEHIPVPRASTHTRKCAHVNVILSHVCARTSPHTSAFKHETRASTRVPLSYTHARTHARMQTHAPFGEDKTGRIERGNRRMGVGARHECEEGRMARVSSPSSLSSYMSSSLLMAMSILINEFTNKFFRETWFLHELIDLALYLKRNETKQYIVLISCASFAPPFTIPYNNSHNVKKKIYMCNSISYSIKKFDRFKCHYRYRNLILYLTGCVQVHTVCFALLRLTWREVQSCFLVFSLYR